MRIEKDSMGEVQVPDDALFGAQTQRAIQNFPISDFKMPSNFIRALAQIKWAAALANAQFGLLPQPISAAIQAAAQAVVSGRHHDAFPVDLFQTGSATSTNMNVNEVIATLANRIRPPDLPPVHPNDHVNMSQSSNDAIPAAIHLSASWLLEHSLLPSLAHLIDTIRKKADEIGPIPKTGRTHLMDAMPITFAQELNAWAVQLQHNVERLKSVQPRLQVLALGGTAVGTGVNAPVGFGARVAQILSEKTHLSLQTSPCYFVQISTQDTAVELSGQLKTLAVSLIKIANDLRWMNSGPLSGLGEIVLPAVQPGSSIMPGKVNPVIPESVAMAAAYVIGADASIGVAGQAGNFQLNTMLPLIAFHLLHGLSILSNSCRNLADKAIVGFTVQKGRVEESLNRNPILVTALNPIIGYELGAVIAKTAYAENRSIEAVASEKTALSPTELKPLLDPLRLTEGGLVTDKGQT